MPMTREEVIKLVIEARGVGETPNLRNADLEGADLGYADLGGANLDFSSWPLWCGGTRAKLDERTTLQLIYHTVNNLHETEDPELRAWLADGKKFAERFRADYRRDAPKLCW